MGRNRKWIQTAILLAIVIVGAVTLAGGLFKGNEPPKVGARAPDFSLSGLDGKTHRLSDFRGKLVILNFWGTFCPPCKAEMPDLEAAYRKWQGDDVVILGVNLNESHVTVSSFVDQLGITFPILLDSQDEIRKKYGVMNFPTTFFIGRDGVIAVKQEGQMEPGFIEQNIKNLLGKGQP